MMHSLSSHLDDLLFSLVAAVPIYIEYIKNHPEALKVLFLLHYNLGPTWRSFNSTRVRSLVSLMLRFSHYLPMMVPYSFAKNEKILMIQFF